MAKCKALTGFAVKGLMFLACIFDMRIVTMPMCHLHGLEL